MHTEYWIPAQVLKEFNANIMGLIEVIEEFLLPPRLELKADGAPAGRPARRARASATCRPQEEGLGGRGGDGRVGGGAAPPRVGHTTIGRYLCGAVP
jgi:hypothetical protein